MSREEKLREDWANPDEYVSNPNFCPECGSDEINAGHSTFENTEAWQAVDCSVCGAEWHDLFTLTGYELVVEPA